MSELLYFTQRRDLRGVLTPIEQYEDVPFNIKRVFYITDMDNYPRGFHGHKECDQVLIALRGSFSVDITDGDEDTKEYTLTSNNMGLFFPRHHWLKMHKFSQDCMILVLCSTPFDENEYIRNYGDFLKCVNNEKPIKFFDLSENTASIRNEVDKAIGKVIDKNAFVLGKELEQFEKLFAHYTYMEHCVGVNNGTSALIVALQALELPKGCDVIVQSNSYIAAPLAVSFCGYNIKVVDIDSSLNLDLDELEKNIDEKTGAIIVVHLYGNCPNMKRLLEIAGDIPVIEDAAQAHGSSYDDKVLGGWGKVGCFSFYPSKNLGAFGEGGAVVTNDKNLYERMKKIRNYGGIKKYEWDIKGCNYRLPNLQAAVLNVKLTYLNGWNEIRRHRAHLYDRLLSEIAQIEIPKRHADYCNHHLYVILVDNRDKLIEHLNTEGIPTSVHYPYTFYSSNAFKEMNGLTTKADDVCKRILSLPMYPEIPEDHVEKVCAAIKSFY